MRTLEHFRQCVDASKSCTGMDEKVRLYAEGKKEQGMGVYDYHHDSGKSDRPEMPALYEKRQEVTEGNPYKAYVEVQADFSADGVLTPLLIVWEDGRRYPIDRILRMDRRASLKAGGAGIRYQCMVCGNPISLYYEENGLWFVERKIPKTE